MRDVRDAAWGASDGRGRREGPEGVGVLGGHAHALEVHVEVVLGERVDARGVVVRGRLGVEVVVAFRTTGDTVVVDRIITRHRLRRDGEGRGRNEVTLTICVV